MPPTDVPDFNRLRNCLLGEATPDRVPLFEIYADPDFILKALREKPIPVKPGDDEALCASVDQWTRFWYRHGYDCIPLFVDLGYTFDWDTSDDTASDGQRLWRREHRGCMTSLDDAARYRWPQPGDVNLAHVTTAAARRPPGMELVVTLPGIIEYASFLMGTETLLLNVHDNPELVKSVTSRIGEHVLATTRTVAALDGVGAVCIGDDWGHRGGCLLSPAQLQRYVFPWVHQCVQAIHDAGRPAILHSCGKVDAVMEDVIDPLGFDAKHSFEEAATPVTEAMTRWGDRLALLGGLDVDWMSRLPREEFRAYATDVLENCQAGGRFALGSGNSLTNYVRLENFTLMLEVCGAPLRTDTPGTNS